MKPVQFPQQNRTWAEGQKPYLALPAYVDGTESVSAWHLSFLERVAVLFTGIVWTRQCYFGQPLQPLHLGIRPPFLGAL